MSNKIFSQEKELQICKQYVEDKLSTMEVAKIHGCDPETIGNIVRRNGYKIRTNSKSHIGQKTHFKKFTKEQELQICDEYSSKERLGIVILGKKWNCGQETIKNILIRNGYDLRTQGESRKIFSKKQEQQICKQYTKDKLSIVILAKKRNCSGTTIWKTIKRNGHDLRPYSEVNSTPEAIQRSLKNGFGKKCYYKGEFFPSLGERDCYIIFIDLGYKVIHNFLDRFDFLVILSNNKKVVVEFHPFDFDLTNKQYYNQRRKLLNKYGYKDLKLVVIKDLKEIENKLVKEGAK